MSALPLLKSPARRPEPTLRPRRAPLQPGRIYTGRAKPMPRQRVRAIESAFERGLLFAGVTIAVFMASSLMGHVLVEKTRRDSLMALSRFRDAKKAEVALQQQVDALTSMGAIQTWAFDHGFRGPEDAKKTGVVH